MSAAAIGGLLTGGSNIIGQAQESEGRGFLSPTQAPFLADLFRRAQDFSNLPTFLGFDPLQVAGQQSALGSLGNLGIGNALGAGQFLTSGAVLDPRTNPFLAQTAQEAVRPIFEGLTQNILPGIRGGAQAAGQVGSSRQGIAEGLASQEALRQAGGISSNIFSQGYGQGLGALTQGLGLAPQTAQLGLLPSKILSGIGAERRGLAQEQLLDPLIQLQRFRDLLGGPILETTQESAGGSGLQGLFGPAGLFGNVGGSGLKSSFAGQLIGGPVGAVAGGVKSLGKKLGF